MKKLFTLLFVSSLMSSHLVFAQADCNCASDGQKYLDKANAPASGEQKLGAPMGGNDIQACSPCAQMAQYLCLCNCETSNETPERVEQMVLQLGEQIANLRSAGVSNCCPEYANKKVSNCKTGKKKDSGSSTGNSSSAPKSPTMAEMNQNFVNFANLLAPFASSPEAVQMIKNINNIHTGAQVAKDILNAGGAGEKALKTVDNIEAIGQVGAVANAWLQESPEMQQKRKEQEEAKQYVNSLNNVVLDIYNKSYKAPEGYYSNNASAELVAAYEKQLNDYDNNTAMQRLLILRYNQYSDPPVISELKNMVNTVMAEQQQYGIENIKYQIAQLSNPSKTKRHLMNTYQSLAQQRGEIENRKKIKQYSESHTAEEVAKYTQQLEQAAKAKKAEEDFKKYNDLAQKKRKSGKALTIIGTGFGTVGVITLLKARSHRQDYLYYDNLYNQNSYWAYNNGSYGSSTYVYDWNSFALAKEAQKRFRITGAIGLVCSAVSITTLSTGIPKLSKAAKYKKLANEAQNNMIALSFQPNIIPLMPNTPLFQNKYYVGGNIRLRF